MKKAFVDTTILTDILLKSGEACLKAKSALNNYDHSELPVYAIKEFSAGPLQNYVWLHNKLVTTGSLAGALEALQQMSRTPRRYLTSTAIQALLEAVKITSDSNLTTKKMIENYGPDAELTAILYDKYRLAIKTKVLKAWQKRRMITSAVVEELSCYKESDPTEVNGLLRINSSKCEGGCFIASRLCNFPNEVSKLVEVLKPEKGREGSRRYRALKQLKRKPKAGVSEDQCRDFGDAVFVILAPKDSWVLTTNKRDHELLAVCIGKKVATPSS